MAHSSTTRFGSTAAAPTRQPQPQHHHFNVVVAGSTQDIHDVDDNGLGEVNAYGEAASREYSTINTTKNKRRKKNIKQQLNQNMYMRQWQANSFQLDSLSFVDTAAHSSTWGLALAAL